MPYIIVRSWYPPSKMDEVVNVYLKVYEKYPEDGSTGEQVVPVATTVSKDGYESMVIYKVERDNVGSALGLVSDRMIEYRNIEGFRYSVQIGSTAEEGLERLGVK